MKSIIEKIVDKIYQNAAMYDDVTIRNNLNNLASEIESMEANAEFEEVARVMVKHLATQTKKYHPHHTVIATSTTCELLEGNKSIGIIMDYVVD